MAAKTRILERVSNFLGLSEGYVNEEDNEIVEREIEETSTVSSKVSDSEKKEKNSNEIEENDFDVDIDTGEGLFLSKKQNSMSSVENKNRYVVTKERTEEEIPEQKPERRSFFGTHQDYKQNSEPASKRGESNNMVNVSESDKMNIFFARPVLYSDDFCREICSNMRSKRMVTISFENVRNDNDKLRIYDFVRGCSVALDCKFEQVSNQVFIVAPCNAKIFKSADREENDENSDRSEGYSFSRY